MRHLFILPLTILAAIPMIAGCKSEPAAPPEPEAPPPKTTQEIYSDYKAALQPLFAGVNGGFMDGMKEPVISAFRTKQSQYSTEINEPEAVGNIERDISTAIGQASDNEQWYALDALLDVHKQLNPTSQRYTTQRRRADLMLARPWIQVTGFATIDAGDLVVFLSVIDPKTRKKDDLRVREGEEFYPDEEGKDILRLVRVIGAQSAVEFEYLRLPGETWEVPGPRNN
ncbi:MAG: hypothetical protein KF886_25655 [Candidatus Hydrogenedentes bacterium]|nr:hypothetical protein [Candidatus Hydrogenedentota bacterium]